MLPLEPSALFRLPFGTGKPVSFSLSLSHQEINETGCLNKRVPWLCTSRRGTAAGRATMGRLQELPVHKRGSKSPRVTQKSTALVHKGRAANMSCVELSSAHTLVQSRGACSPLRCGLSNKEPPQTQHLHRKSAVWSLDPLQGKQQSLGTAPKLLQYLPYLSQPCRSGLS